MASRLHRDGRLPDPYNAARWAGCGRWQLAALPKSPRIAFNPVAIPANTAESPAGGSPTIHAVFNLSAATRGPAAKQALPQLSYGPWTSQYTRGCAQFRRLY